MNKLFWLVIVSSIILPAGVYASADNYIYPMSTWNVTTQHGEHLSDGTYHMGVDAGYELGTDAEVYAVADGVVKHVGTHTRFGLVILIEHDTPGRGKNVSLYGHLNPNNARVSTGMFVHAGDVIGYLGDASVNGGWAPHIHFGIHKSPYTGQWVYYGHVPNPQTANDWFEPSQYIQQYLTRDNWKPFLSWDISKGEIVTHTISGIVNASDKGSGLASLRFFISDNLGNSWTHIASTNQFYGKYQIQLPVSRYHDGRLFIKVIAKDKFNNEKILIEEVYKDVRSAVTPAFIGASPHHTGTAISRWSMSGREFKDGLFFPFTNTWKNPLDVAQHHRIATVGGSQKKAAMVKIFSKSGQFISAFRAFSRGSARVAIGDISGDGEDDVIVGSGKRQLGLVRAFSQEGDLLWEKDPLSTSTRSGFDVAIGDVNGDGINEVLVGTRKGPNTQVVVLSNNGDQIINTFFPFGSNSRKGVNITSGDVDGDGDDDIIVGNETGKYPVVKMYTGEGERIGKPIHPFEKKYFGGVDVSTMQWDVDEGPVEVVVSQSALGSAKVKIYRQNEHHDLLFEHIVRDASHVHGIRIAGWQ